MLGPLSTEEIIEVLHRNSIGRIACSDNNVPYVVPVSYVYEDNRILCHAREGMKISIMRRNPNVCFQIDDIQDFDNWRSVVLWGQYHEMLEEEEIQHAQQYFSELMLEMKTTESAEPPETQQQRFHDVKPEYVPAIFYQISISKMSGRFQRSL